MALASAGAGCAAAAPIPFTPEVAPIASATSAPDEQLARELLIAGRWAEATDGFDALARFEVDPERRAEFSFFAAEAAFASGDHQGALRRYRQLLERYPTSPRVPLTVERTFLLGRLFAEGLAHRPSVLLRFDVEDRKLGVEVLEEFLAARGQHPLADDALFYVGVAHEGMGAPLEAVVAWDRLVAEYPRSSWVQSAELRAGLAFRAVSDGTDYDKRPLLTALERLRGYLARHPAGDHVVEARAAVAALEEELAAHRLEVARWYLRRGRTYAARVYLEGIDRDFKATEVAREASRLASTLPAESPPPPPPDPDLRAPRRRPAAYPAGPVEPTLPPLEVPND